MDASTVSRAPSDPPLTCRDAEAAVDAIDRIYRSQIGFLQSRFREFEAGGFDGRVRAVYPMARLVVDEEHAPALNAAFGFADQPGMYEGTFTRVDLFRAHLLKQSPRIAEIHGGPIEVAL